MKEFIQKCWKVVTIIMGTVALIGSILMLPTYVATPADLEKVKADTKQTIQELKKSIELDRDLTRLNNLNDSLLRGKMLQRQYPKDRDIKEDLDALKAEKQKVQERIEKK